MNVKHFLDHCLLLGRDHLTLVNIGAAIYAQDGWLAIYLTMPSDFFELYGRVTQGRCILVPVKIKDVPWRVSFLSWLHASLNEKSS